MKEKIFNKMIEYGWNLGENKYEDFNNVYDIHKSFLDSCYDYKCEVEEDNEILNMNDISVSSFEDMLDFITDFLRAIDDIDKDTIKTKILTDEETENLLKKEELTDEDIEDLDNKCISLENEIKYLEEKLNVCGYGKQELYEIDYKYDLLERTKKNI